ncbi:uncharacterized protein METZ01_LOCUS50332 [marine metagenome]|uniref:Uncharacterized protein n=1 Tax=marine metagenome TaxID=408172 RepID=A0A381S2D2_9ZZZZ
MSQLIGTTTSRTLLCIKAYENVRIYDGRKLAQTGSIDRSYIQ